MVVSKLGPQLGLSSLCLNLLSNMSAIFDPIASHLDWLLFGLVFYFWHRSNSELESVIYIKNQGQTNPKSKPTKSAPIKSIK
jgi:hypothetical protein